jgi:hypothetical protein
LNIICEVEYSGTRTHGITWHISCNRLTEVRQRTVTAYGVGTSVTMRRAGCCTGQGRDRTVTAAAWDRCQTSGRGNCGGQTGTGTALSASAPMLPVSIFPPMLHTHSFIYHQRCMFFSQYFSFPLSVSFHQCPILIHSSTTDALILASDTVVKQVASRTLLKHTRVFLHGLCPVSETRTEHTAHPHNAC